MIIGFAVYDTCPPDQFKCTTNGRCLPPDYRCDHEFDCEDKSDEVRGALVMRLAAVLERIIIVYMCMHNLRAIEHTSSPS